MKILKLSFVIFIYSVSFAVQSGNKWKLEINGAFVDSETSEYQAYVHQSNDIFLIGIRKKENPCPYASPQESVPIKVSDAFIKMVVSCWHTDSAIEKKNKNQLLINAKTEQYNQLVTKQNNSNFLSMSTIGALSNLGTASGLSHQEQRTLNTLYSEITKLSAINYADLFAYYPKTNTGKEYLIQQFTTTNEVCFDDRCFSTEGFNEVYDVVTGETPTL